MRDTAPLRCVKLHRTRAQGVPSTTSAWRPQPQTHGAPSTTRSLLQVHLDRRLLGQPLILQGIVRRPNLELDSRLGRLGILLLSLVA